MGGWYNPRGLYVKDELHGLPCHRFCEALIEEGVPSGAGANAPLHVHPMFHESDVFNIGRPTMTAFAQRDVRQGKGSLPVSESINEIAFGIPWFKHCDEKIIGQYASAFRKVVENHMELLK